MIHELGHNFWFDHSGVGDKEYDDRSGYMGGSEELPPGGIFGSIINAFRINNNDKPLLRAFVSSRFAKFGNF